MSHLRKTVPLLAACLAIAGCTEPLDFDLRGNLGGFSTAPAARTATAERPQADARGVISYPNYQVAVARRGDTVADVASRVGVDAGALARFNGIDVDVGLRDGEVLALPARVSEPAPGTPGAIDITTLAGNAIDNAPATTPVETTTLEPSPAAAAPVAQEPVRHKVERGETAFTIARLYNVPVRSLGEWNGLGSDFAIREGQFLLIPVASQTPPRRGAAGAADVTQPGSGSPTPTPPSSTTPLPDEQVQAADTPSEAEPPVDVGTPSRSSGAAMALPVQGRIIRDYAKGRNDGIDIASDPGTPVAAAADGTVAAITEDANNVPIIVVRHPDNVLTVYANVDGIAVNKGDQVKRGQKLAQLREGDNAYVHFEVREGFESVDPTPYLN
ncbi:peptidoglycan DD-metalloendopeptidase family protein [Thalassococcus sp. S3]|uniref:peptidoglycan DD-metalloendopeptidase family protein n=1 Tax=Thalassococcus sp. S3 TaxID=2017482 RepID=UPI0010248E5A|nr:peptidoglycan DD-metalloendopeptidase family protein [Thalassococcus sp. S3]QBF31382.1 peptidase M23 [Thalassococcus sp. S3]